MNESIKKELIVLLNNRFDDNFDKAQWDRLYALINSALNHISVKRAMNSSEEGADLVADFLIEKILSSRSTFTDIPYFYQAFKNFCFDRYRSLNAQKRGANITESYDSKLESNYAQFGDGNVSTFDKISLEIKNELELLGLNSGEQDPADMTFSDENKSISDSAKAWLIDIEKDEGEWVTAYLGIHICPTDGSKSLNTLGRMMHLESYDYKARKLGITGVKKGFWSGYEKTFIGKWMLQLNVAIGEDPITEETQSQFLNCLKILCQIALIRITDPIYTKLLSRT